MDSDTDDTRTLATSAAAPPAAPRLDYATPEPRGRSRLVWAGRLCCGLWLGGLVLSGFVQSGPIFAAALAMAPAALVLGLLARGDADREVRRGAKFVIGFASFELLLMLAVALILPSMGRAREPSKRIMCAANLGSLYKACYLYASESGGRFPPDLAQVIADEDISTDVLICPSTSDDKAVGPTTQAVLQTLRTTTRHCSYVYRGAGLTLATASGRHVIAHDSPGNHGAAGGTVVYGNGSTEFLDARRLAHVIAELDAGQNPPRAAPGGQ